MHGFGAHLELHIDTGGTHQGGVQGLVAIDFADGNMVLEFPRYRLVELMQGAKRRIAISDIGHHNPEAINVGHLGKAQVLFIHFFVDGVQGFFSSCNPYLHAAVGECSLKFTLHFFDQVPSATARLGHRLGQNGITPGLQMAERQILEFAIGLVQAQAVRDWGIDVECF